MPGSALALQGDLWIDQNVVLSDVWKPITYQSCEQPPAHAGVTTEEGAAKGRRLPSELLPVPLAHLTRPSFQPFRLSSLLQPTGLLTGPAASNLGTASAATPLAGQGSVAMASGRQWLVAGLQSEVSTKHKATNLTPWVCGESLDCVLRPVPRFRRSLLCLLLSPSNPGYLFSMKKCLR